MNTYLAYHLKHKAPVVVYADTSYQAQYKAAVMFNSKKAYEVTVVLAEMDGAPVIHSGASL